MDELIKKIKRENYKGMPRDAYLSHKKWMDDILREFEEWVREGTPIKMLQRSGDKYRAIMAFEMIFHFADEYMKSLRMEAGNNKEHNDRYLKRQRELERKSKYNGSKTNKKR